MTIHDISMTISEEMQVYKNKVEKKPKIVTASSFERDGVYESQLIFNLHTGTHMDFPLHIFKEGNTSDQLDLSKLIRKVKVFDLIHVKEAIDQDDLKDMDIQKNDFVLFKTRNSLTESFDFKFVFISQSAAQYLADLGISGIGVDALGVERDQKGHPTHKILMNHDIIIIEGLRLKDIREDTYLMIALPIKIKHVDALPLSIILIEEPYANQIGDTR